MHVHADDSPHDDHASESGAAGAAAHTPGPYAELLWPAIAGAALAAVRSAKKERNFFISSNKR